MNPREVGTVAPSPPPPPANKFGREKGWVAGDVVFTETKP